MEMKNNSNSSKAKPSNKSLGEKKRERSNSSKKESIPPEIPPEIPKFIQNMMDHPLRVNDKYYNEYNRLYDFLNSFDITPTVKQRRIRSQATLANLANLILLGLQCKTMRDTNEVYSYHEEKGYWEGNTDSYIAMIVHSISPHFTKPQISEIIDKIRRMTPTNRDIFGTKNVIGLGNGVFNLDTWTFELHKPENYLLTCLDINYESGVFPFLFDKFLSRILPESQHNLILEIMAYVFINDYRYNKAFLFNGEGDNGKSTLLNVFVAFFGEKNIEGFSIQNFDSNQFAASQLFGKLANINDDMSEKSMYTTSVFKTLTGNMYASYNVKNKKAIHFRNRAKMIFGSNKLPIIYEDTIAIWRRLCVIFFNEIIPEEEQDKELHLKLTTPEELSGILNLVLISLKNLLDRGRFEGLKSIADERKQYIETTDIIHAFCENVLELDPMGWVSSDDLFKTQCLYAKEIKIPAKTKQTLTKHLQIWLPEADNATKKFGNKKKKGVRGWANLKIKDEWMKLLKVKLRHWVHDTHVSEYPDLLRNNNTVSGEWENVVYPVPKEKNLDIPLTPDFWKENILQIVKNAGEGGIIKKDLLEKTTKILRLGVGYYNQLNEMIDELLSDNLIIEPKKDIFQFIPQGE